MIMSGCCGAFEVRSLDDALGATCAHRATLLSSGCGISLCSGHAEQCDFVPRVVLPDLPFVS